MFLFIKLQYFEQIFTLGHLLLSLRHRTYGATSLRQNYSIVVVMTSFNKIFKGFEVESKAESSMNFDRVQLQTFFDEFFSFLAQTRAATATLLWKKMTSTSKQLKIDEH